MPLPERSQEKTSEKIAPNLDETLKIEDPKVTENTPVASKSLSKE